MFAGSPIVSVLCVLIHVSLSHCKDELLFTQVAWRHGDRTPTTTCKNDPNQASAWEKFGGWGQLTPRGMQQQVTLGDLLYREYAVNDTFLGSRYQSTEVYIRSTDLNRTIVSAMSNLIGMYYNRSNAEPGRDYPEAGKWPAGYVPIPIHTVENSDDYVCNPDAYCPRQDWIWSEAEKTTDVINWKEKSKDITDLVTELCGESVDIINLWKFKDAFLIERDHNMPVLVNDTQFNRMVAVNAHVEDMQNGLDITSYQGLDFKTEIGKIRGGSLLWDIIRRMDLKLYCMNATASKDSSCTWMKNLKYYAYSVHDTTVGALLAVLGAKPQVVQQGGYPAYTSAVLTELWNSDKGPCLKFKFHRNFSENGFETITQLVKGCEDSDCCLYKYFREGAKVFYPGDERKLCQDVSSRSTSFDPDKPASNTNSSTSAVSQIRVSLSLLAAPLAALIFGISSI